MRLLRATNERQREVSDALYDAYSKQRFAPDRGTAFQARPLARRRRSKWPSGCSTGSSSSRSAKTGGCCPRTRSPRPTRSPAFTPSPNPQVAELQEPVSLHRRRARERNDIHEYNGGLFAAHPVDDLELPDEPWTTFFTNDQRLRLRRRSESRRARPLVRAVDHGAGKAQSRRGCSAATARGNGSTPRCRSRSSGSSSASTTRRRN